MELIQRIILSLSLIITEIARRRSLPAGPARGGHEWLSRFRIGDQAIACDRRHKISVQGRRTILKHRHPHHYDGK